MSDRYAQDPNGKLVPEGIEGRVAAKGPLAELVYQLGGRLARPAWATAVREHPAELHQNARFLRVSPAPACARATCTTSVITKEAPNYRIE